MKNSKSNLLEQEWLLECLERLPQGMLSRAWGQLARTRYPKTFVRLLQRFFVAANDIDLSEAEEKLGDFASLEELFIRKLKAGARRIDPDPEVMVSPVDGTLGSCGSIEDGTLWQIKGKTYTLEDLLDEDDEAETSSQPESVDMKLQLDRARGLTLKDMYELDSIISEHQ